MSDDIIDRLRCAYSKGDEPPCEACTFCVARAEIERLRAALAIASGMISTMPQYEHEHPIEELTLDRKDRHVETEP